MPKVVVTHAVGDLDRWLQGKDERRAAFEDAGARDVTDHVAQDGSKQIAITCELDDLGGLQSMMASPPSEIAALMEKHTVTPPFGLYVER